MIFTIIDLSSREKAVGHFALPSGYTLGDVFEKDEKLKKYSDNIIRVDVNGMERRDWRSLSPQKQDRVLAHVVPKDFGIIEGITLGQILSAVSAAISIVRFIVSLFSHPKQPHSAGAGDRSQTYGFDGIKDSFPPGDVIPVVYGRHRKGGQVLMYNITSDVAGKTQRMKMLLAMCEGRVSSISDIEINGLSVDNFKNVNIRTTLGEPEGIIFPGYEEIANTYFDGRPITDVAINCAGSHSSIIYRTTGNNVYALDLQIRAPNGMQWIRVKKKTRKYPNSSWFSVEYKHSDDIFWTFVATHKLDDKTDQPVLDVMRVDLPSPGEYDLRFIWLGAYKYCRNLRTKYSEQAVWQLELTNVTEYSGTMPSHSGTCMIAVDAVATQQLQGGRPNVTAVIHGKSVREYFAANSYLERWSNNPAWALRDYMTSSVYGMGAYLSEADLDMQSFLDFATLANSDVQLCGNATPPSPRAMDPNPGQVFYDRNAVTAIQGDKLGGGTGITVSTDFDATSRFYLKLMSREYGQSRYGITYTHICCPPVPAESPYDGPYGANSPDLPSDGFDMWMQYAGEANGPAISGLIAMALGGTAARSGTAITAVYDTTGQSPCISVHLYHSQDMTSWGTIVASVPYTLQVGQYFFAQHFPNDFSAASGYYSQFVFVGVYDAAFHSLQQTICDTVLLDPLRMPHNGDGLAGVTVMPAYNASYVEGGHQWNNWFVEDGLCYAAAYTTLRRNCKRNFISVAGRFVDD
jgi:hypothetical protein